MGILQILRNFRIYNSTRMIDFYKLLLRVLFLFTIPPVEFSERHTLENGQSYSYTNSTWWPIIAPLAIDWPTVGWMEWYIHKTTSSLGNLSAQWVVDKNITSHLSDGHLRSLCWAHSWIDIPPPDHSVPLPSSASSSVSSLSWWDWPKWTTKRIDWWAHE